MQILRKNKALLRRIDPYALLLLLSAMGTCFCMHLILGTGFAASSPYNTYTLQAMAWRNGSLHLPHDFPWLELAIYEGNYYVSFPPLPSVVLLPLTFLFGEQTPDNLLVQLYGLGACLGVYSALKASGMKRPAAALLSYLIPLSSSALPMFVNGAVWYQAQMLALMLTCLSIAAMLKGRPTLSLFVYALSVACRPFNALYGPVLYMLFFRRRTPALDFNRASFRRLIPGTALGLAVAAAIGVFNAVRFGNPLEFGHNYLPEFSFQGGIQFSLQHVANNLKTFLLGLPLEKSGASYSFRAFGYSLLIACPTVTLMLARCLRDIIKKQFSLMKGFLLFTMLLHIFLLLLHRTFGGYQLGARYVVDVIPYTICYFALSPGGKRWQALCIAALLFSLAFTIAGLSAVHL